MSYPGYPPAGGYPPPGGYPPGAYQPGSAPYPGQQPAAAAYPPGAYGAPPPGAYGAPPAGYGAPPPGAYGAPPAGYGAPPPPGAYGAPPAGYGAAPPPGAYGAAPPPGAYGAAPPPGAYGAPPAGYAGAYGAPPGAYGQPAGYGPPPAGYAGYGAPQPGYGAPPPQGYAPPPGGAPPPAGAWDRAPPPAAAAPAPAAAPAAAPAPAAAAAGAAPAVDPHAAFSAERPQQGTVVPFAGFNAETDAAALRKAMKGIGTDEKAIIDVLSKRTAIQRKQISTTFKVMYGKDLEKELKSELSGKFEDVVLGLLRDPAHFDAECLRKAMKGAGTDERALIEVICTRSNDELHRIKSAYNELYKRDLEKDVISETSGHFKRLLVSCLACGREESNKVDIALAQREAAELKAAGVGRWGTDESKFNQVLCLRSFPQLRATFEEYRKVAGIDMVRTIDREMSGSVGDAFKAVVQSVINRPGYFAERLYASMKGAGTDDETLVRIIVARSEIDMVQIKQVFFDTYHKSLAKRISEDTSGDYKKVLCALVGE